MSPNCIHIDQIGDIESAPEGHPLRQHVAECPRCQSLWLSYQSFMKADTAGVKDLEAARRALAATIHERAGSAAGAALPRTSRMSARPMWPAWLRPALIAATAAVVAVVAVSVWRGGSDDSVLRGGDDSAWSLSAPQLSAHSIVFEWKAVPDADAYDVQVFDDTLTEVYGSGAVTTLSTTVDRSLLTGVAAGTTLTWRVRALRAGDVISWSPPSSLKLQ